MSKQPGSFSLIHKKRRSSYCKTEEMLTNTIAKVMLNYNIEVRRVYTATIIDVSALTICGKRSCYEQYKNNMLQYLVSATPIKRQTDTTSTS